MKREKKSAVVSGQWAVYCRQGHCAPHAATAHRLLPTAHSPRGITLIELLITMVIIAIISAAILGTAAAAMENARRTRTRTTITKIHTLLLERMPAYETRRVDVNPAITLALNSHFSSTPALQKFRGVAAADMRLLALRELMKFEMPDRRSDVVDDILNSVVSPIFLSRPPALAQMYWRRLQGASVNNQGAECLYLVVMSATGDGEARTLFNDQDIGDTDNDGAPEILDGWGQPISWVRWPAGFALRSSFITAFEEPEYDPQADHDPFDFYRRDALNTQPLASSYPSTISTIKPPLRLGEYVARLRNVDLSVTSPAFRLMPLVYSSGPDGISDIKHASVSFLDPYAKDADGYISGRPEDDVNEPNGEFNYLDNIHNHLIEY